MKTFNEWFLSLPKERQDILKEDKWMLAENAYKAGQNSNKECPHNDDFSTFGYILDNGEY